MQVIVQHFQSCLKSKSSFSHIHSFIKESMLNLPFSKFLITWNWACVAMFLFTVSVFWPQLTRYRKDSLPSQVLLNRKMEMESWNTGSIDIKLYRGRSSSRKLHGWPKSPVTPSEKAVSSLWLALYLQLGYWFYLSFILTWTTACVRSIPIFTFISPCYQLLCNRNEWSYKTFPLSIFP